jgi:hypothetical protein
MRKLTSTALTKFLSGAAMSDSEKAAVRARTAAGEAQPAASQVEMETGTEAGLRSMSPQRVRQSITKTAVAGVAASADQATTPNDGDTLLLVESASVLKKLSITNLWAWILNKVQTTSLAFSGGAGISGVSGLFFADSRPAVKGTLVDVVDGAFVTFDGVSGRIITQTVNPPLVNSGQTIYVDATAGADTRGSLSRYNAGKPFATIGAAVAASATGDTVLVMPGSYTVASTINLDGKGGLFFMQGATVTGSSNVVVFSYSHASVPFVVGGFADFVVSGTGGILTKSGASQMVFRCNSVTSAGTGNLFACSGGTLGVEANLVTASAATVFSLTSTGRLAVKADTITCLRLANINATAGTGGGTFTINAWTVVSGNGDGMTIVNALSVAATITNFTNQQNQPLVRFSLGSDTGASVFAFRNTKFATAGNQPAIIFDSATATNKSVSLVGCALICSSATNSIVSNSARTVVAANTIASHAVNASTTISGAALTVSTAYIGTT